MSSKTMHLHSLFTEIPANLAAPSVLSGGAGGFFFGQAVGGLSGAAAGAIAGAAVGIIGAFLTALVAMRKQNTDGAIALDKERDAVIDRANTVHQAEVTALHAMHARENEITAREKEFLQSQVSYHEQLELATRKRLHAMVGEVQRCVTYITLAETACREKSFNLDLPPFKIRTYDDIVDMFPLPAAAVELQPTHSSRGNSAVARSR